MAVFYYGLYSGRDHQIDYSVLPFFGRRRNGAS
jgi:hypothetical protein